MLFIDEADIKQFLQAAKEGNQEQVKKLLNKGVPINTYDPADPEKNTALHLAIEHNQHDMVVLLLNQHANPHQPKANKNESFPVHLAVKRGHANIVQALVDHGANIDQTDKAGMTALHLAVAGNHLSIVLLLLLDGADINKKNIFGATALQTAALKRNQNILKILITYSSFVFCLEESYIDFLARLMGSSIKENYKLHEQINSMIPVKVTMLWEQNEKAIKKNLTSILPPDYNIDSYLDYAKNFLLQCIVKRLQNKIHSNLHDLSEFDSDSSIPSTPTPHFTNPLKDKVMETSPEIQALTKKMDVLKVKMYAHAERLEFEEALKLRDEIYKINTELKKFQPTPLESTETIESTPVEYGGILCQMKPQENPENTKSQSTQLRNKLYLHAQKLEFEEAARLRDEIIKFEEDSLK